MKVSNVSEGNLTYNERKCYRQWHSLRDSRIDEEQTIEGNRKFLHELWGWIHKDHAKSFTTKRKLLNQIHILCRDSGLEVFKIFDESDPESIDEGRKVALDLNEWIKGRYPDPTTARQAISFLEQAAKLIRKYHFDKAPNSMCAAMGKFEKPDAKKYIVRADMTLKWEDVLKIVNAAPTWREKAVIMLMMEGSRPSDPFNIQIKDIRGHNDPSKAWKVAVNGKTSEEGEHRIISLSYAQPYLKKFLQHHFFNVENKSPTFKRSRMDEDELGPITNLPSDAFLITYTSNREVTKAINKCRANLFEKDKNGDWVMQVDFPEDLRTKITEKKENGEWVVERKVLEDRKDLWSQITYTAYRDIFINAAIDAGFDEDRAKKMTARIFRKSFANDAGKWEGMNRGKLNNLMNWCESSNVSKHYLKRDDGEENQVIKQGMNGEEVTVYRPQHQGRVITCKHCSERTMAHSTFCMFCDEELDAFELYVKKEQQGIEALQRQIADLQSQLAAQQEIELVKPGEKIQEGTA